MRSVLNGSRGVWRRWVIKLYFKNGTSGRAITSFWQCTQQQLLRTIQLQFCRPHIRKHFSQIRSGQHASRGSTGKCQRLIPVRIVDFKPSGLLAAIVYIDLVKHFKTGDKDGAKQTLLQGINKDRAKPDREPPFPGLQR